jgi:mannose-6-phosphate isomerase-like protein (cupin superfamily)
METHRIEDFIGGWFIGNFAPSLLRTEAFEVGWKVHNREEGVEPHIHHIVTEYNLLASGSMTVNGVLLKPGEIFILRPGERVDVEIHSEEVAVVCVKTPSIPSDKEKCAQS